MSGFTQWLLSRSFLKAGAMALVRHFATGLGVSIVTWLLAHHADPGQSQEFVNYLIGAAVTGTGVVWSMFDTKNVGTKMATSADAGAAQVQQAVIAAQSAGEDVQRAADQARADAVKTALAAADKKASTESVDDVLARMRAGAA